LAWTITELESRKFWSVTTFDKKEKPSTSTGRDQREEVPEADRPIRERLDIQHFRLIGEELILNHDPRRLRAELEHVLNEVC
jgi:hypothetical protein